MPTLTQIKRARNDNGLRARIMLAADILGISQGEAEVAHAQIIAKDTTDDGGTAITIAGAYDYHWGQLFTQAASNPPADRDDLTTRIARLGTDPSLITDGTIERAVRAILTP